MPLRLTVRRSIVLAVCLSRELLTGDDVLVQELGWRTVPTVFVDLDDARTRQLHALVLQGGEPRERERHAVRARLQALDRPVEEFERRLLGRLGQDRLRILLRLLEAVQGAAG